jgi:hypothetical protein
MLLNQNCTLLAGVSSAAEKPETGDKTESILAQVDLSKSTGSARSLLLENIYAAVVEVISQVFPANR